MKTIHAIGMSWYTPENFKTLMTMFDDRNNIRLSYAEWLKAAELVVMRHQREGKKVLKINIDTVQFPRWCESQQMPLNAQSRMAYTNHMASNIGEAGVRQTRTENKRAEPVTMGASRDYAE